ncbi:MAG: tetratricopeptide repeat protein [Ignavibacteria bacterium]|nr:tetratricopeptide repeat protein [Ignavibacteria bacterium]
MNYIEIQTRIDAANAANNDGNYDEAEHIAFEVLEELDSFTAQILKNIDGSSEPLLVGDTDPILLRTDALFVLVYAAHRRGMFNAALEHAERILALAEQYSLNQILPKAWNALGNIYLYLGTYDKSLENYTKALAVFEELGLKPNVATIMGNIGLVYYSLGIYDKSMECNTKALATFEELGSKKGIANTLRSIGLVYIHLGDNDMALEYFSKSLSIIEELGEKTAVAVSMGSIGAVYLNLKSYDKSLEFYSKSLSIHEELGEKSSVAREMGNIGNLYQIVGLYDKSLEYMFQALSVHEALGAKAPSALVMGCIGLLYANQKFEGYDSYKSEEYLLKAIALNEEIGAKHNLYENHLYLANHYKQNGRWKDFAFHFERYHDIEKAVRSEEAQRKTEQLEYQRKIEESERDRQVKLARFQEQEKILHNILPANIADRMLDGEKTIADSHENVSVFFSDIVGFTKLSQQVNAQDLVGMLNGIFSQFDQLARKHGLEKIKTIGDAYMAVCGAPIHIDNHAERTALFALEVADMMNNYSTVTSDKVSIRIGLHSGSVVAGIIGENKFAYDMWGDAVNTASRMESHGEPGKIHVSEEFKHAVETFHATSLQFIRRGEINIKGKGMMKTYFLEKNI